MRWEGVMKRLVFALALLVPLSAQAATGSLDAALQSGSTIGLLDTTKVPGCSILDDARHAAQMSDPREFMFEASKDGEWINGRPRECKWLSTNWDVNLLEKVPAGSTDGAFYCVWFPVEESNGQRYMKDRSKTRNTCLWTFLKDEQIETAHQQFLREVEEAKKQREQKLRKELGL
jgi:Zn-finger protein